MAVVTKAFVSATSNDMKSFRQEIKDFLWKKGIHPVVQEDFTLGYKTLREKLESLIGGCDIVLCLVGFVYGAEPFDPPPDQPRRSYTQFEHDVATALQKPVYLFLADPGCDFDNPSTEADELRALQRAHYEGFLRHDPEWGRFTSKADLLKQLGVMTFPAPPEARPESARIFELPAFPLARAFKGREGDLRRLHEAWRDPHTNVLTVHAWGGAGKSTLIGYWVGELERDKSRRPQAVYGYSFEGTAGDKFVEAALRRFGDPDPTLGNPEDKGNRLADLVRRQRTLLLLDGFQALQETEGEVGRIKSPALRALTSSLAVSNPGLCVIVSRLPVAGVSPTAPVHELKELSPDAGTAVLKALGVTGPEDELKRAVEEVKGHALSLDLLGSYLSAACGGDVYRRYRIRLLAEDAARGRHAYRIMKSYEKFLKPRWWTGPVLALRQLGGRFFGPDGRAALESPRWRALAVLYVISLFSRPARRGALVSVLKGQVIPGLTAGLPTPGTEDWNRLVSYLRRHRLLFDASAKDNQEILDMHPLVREYFADRLRRQMPRAFREGHRRLYEHFRGETPELPKDTDLMGPLYLAAIHGCRAGAHADVLDKVYWPRMKRGDKAFNTRELGAYFADLTLLGEFFGKDWRRLHEGVDPRWEARLLYEAAFDLRALGRLNDAPDLFRRCLEAHIRQGEWADAAKTAGDLSLLFITLGKLSDACEYARFCVSHADQSGCPFERVRARSNLVHALVQIGRLDEARSAFREAEAVVDADKTRAAPLASGRSLPTLQSYWFYELHLEIGDYDKVDELASRPLTGPTPTGTPHLDWALAETALARSRMGRAGASAHSPSADPAVVALLEEARRRLTDALKEMDQAGTKHHRPRVLLASAALHRMRREWPKAVRDLEEAQAIATDGGMEVHQADILLEYARLHLDRGAADEARGFFHHARDVVARIDYQRRRAEIAELSRALAEGA